MWLGEKNLVKKCQTCFERWRVGGLKQRLLLSLKTPAHDRVKLGMAQDRDVDKEPGVERSVRGAERGAEGGDEV